MSWFFSWFGKSAPSEDRLIEGWEALDQEISTEQRIDELDRLRRLNSNQIREKILVRLNQAMPDGQTGIGQLPLRGQGPVLGSNLRSRLFKDLLMKVSPDWLKRLDEIVPDISEQWYPSSCQKNLLGQILSMLDKTAPDQLTKIGLSQIIKSIHLSLVTILGIHLTDPKSNSILEMIMDSLIGPIIQLWTETADRVKKSLEKQGKLPEKWAQARQAEEERLRSRVSARFSDGSLDKPIKIPMKERKQLLEERLHPKKESIQVPGIGTANFISAKASLEQLFKKR